MGRGNFDNLVLKVRLDRKQRALQDALLVPWRQLEASADEYVEWHTSLLWVRTIVEAAGGVPDGIRSELRTRCPGFPDSDQSVQQQPIWKLLEESLAAEHFAQAKAGGWFDAVMYYAYKDVRVEQAWSLWEKTKAAWRRSPPARWPTFDSWNVQTATTYALAQGETEKARAVAAMGNFHRDRLQSFRNIWALPYAR
jgi:hypothetical protein